MGRDLGQPVPPDRVELPIEAPEFLLEAVFHRAERALELGVGLGAALVDDGPRQAVVAADVAPGPRQAPDLPGLPEREAAVPQPLHRYTNAPAPGIRGVGKDRATSRHCQ
jgi:hypothetical protein